VTLLSARRSVTLKFWEKSGNSQLEPKRFVVGTLDCDALGHMNVARYYAFCNLGGIAMQTEIGWPPGQANKGRRYSFAVVTEQSNFLAELHAGETVLVHNGISRIGTKSAVFEMWLTREDGTVVFESTWKSALLDLDSRRAVAVPDDLRAALQPYLVETRNAGFAAGL